MPKHHLQHLADDLQHLADRRSQPLAPNPPADQQFRLLNQGLAEEWGQRDYPKQNFQRIPPPPFLCQLPDPSDQTEMFVGVTSVW